MASPGLAGLTTIAASTAANAGPDPFRTLQDVLGTSAEVKDAANHSTDARSTTQATSSNNDPAAASGTAGAFLGSPQEPTASVPVTASLPDASSSPKSASAANQALAPGTKAAAQTAANAQTQAASTAQASGQPPAQTSTTLNGQPQKAAQSLLGQDTSGQDTTASPAAAIPAAGTDGAAAAIAIPNQTANPATPTPIAQHSLLATTSTAERVQVVNQVAQQIQAMHGANSPQDRTVTMQLHPDQWGPVTISVTTHGAADGPASVSAVVTTAHDDAQTLLRQNSQDLKDALSSAGLRLDKLDIQTATVVAASASHGADGHQQGQSDTRSGQWTAPQHGASPQAGSQGGHGGFASAFGHEQSQRQTYAPDEPSGQISIDGRTAPLSAVLAHAGSIDLHA